MIEMITEMFSYSFMVHAIVAGLFLSLCASLLGVSLVLKRYSMIDPFFCHQGLGCRNTTGCRWHRISSFLWRSIMIPERHNSTRVLVRRD